MPREKPDIVITNNRTGERKTADLSGGMIINTTNPEHPRLVDTRNLNTGNLGDAAEAIISLLSYFRR